METDEPADSKSDKPEDLSTSEPKPGTLLSYYFYCYMVDWFDSVLWLVLVHTLLHC